MTRALGFRAGLGAAILAAALLAPAAADARAVVGAGAEGIVEPRLEVRTSNGYDVVVSGEGDLVTIGVSRANVSPGAGAFTAYLARGHADAAGISAVFGPYGRVDVRFTAAPGPVRPGAPPDCAGDGPGTTRYGNFTGTIRFRGENGYAAVTAHRAPGELVTPASNACSPVDGSLIESMHGAFATIGRDAPFRSTLEVTHREGPGGVFFEAERGAYAGFIALRERIEGQVAVYDYAFAKAPGPTFATFPALNAARVAPPAPFSGIATLTRGAAGARTWAGDLNVSFPGSPSVPLTGPDFRTHLARSFP